MARTRLLYPPLSLPFACIRYRANAIPVTRIDWLTRFFHEAIYYAFMGCLVSELMGKTYNLYEYGLSSTNH